MRRKTNLRDDLVNLLESEPFENQPNSVNLMKCSLLANPS